MTGKSLGLAVGLVACIAAGYGFGSGWIRLGPPGAPESSASPGVTPRQLIVNASPFEIDREVVRTSTFEPQTPPTAAPANPLPPQAQPPAAPVPAAPVPAAPAAGVPAPAPNPSPKPAATLDAAAFQMQAADLIATAEVAKSPVFIDPNGLIRSDGPELTLNVSLDGLTQGVTLPVGADQVPQQVTIALKKSSTTQYTLPAIVPPSADPSPTYTQIITATAPAKDGDTPTFQSTPAFDAKGKLGPFAFTVPEAGTYILTVTRQALGTTTQGTRVFTIQPINHFPPTITGIEQTASGAKTTVFSDLTGQVELTDPPFQVDVATAPNRKILIVNRGNDTAIDNASATIDKSKGTVAVTPVVSLVDSPLTVVAVDSWTLERSNTATVVIPGVVTKAADAAAAKKNGFIEYTEFGRRRKNPDGFNPADKVETRVCRLYYYRDALKVAQIINRDVEVRNKALVDTRRRQADETRRQADTLTDNRRLQDEKAIRAAQASREAERNLKQAQASLAQADSTAAAVGDLPAQSAALDSQTAGLKAEAGRLSTGIADAQKKLDLPATDPAAPTPAQRATLQSFVNTSQFKLDQNTNAQATIDAQQAQVQAQIKARANPTGVATPAAATAAGTVTTPPPPAPLDISGVVTKTDAERKTAQANLDAAKQALQAKRQAETQESDAKLSLDLQEERAREQQFRDEVAAATTDADIFAPGKPSSDDPVRQVSVSVIGDSLIQLRGPIKGINIIRMMINEIDAPAGQVRIGIHTVQVNGEHEDRMEVVTDRIRHYVDHSRFLTMQSAQMLRKSVVVVASRKANEAAQQFADGPEDQRQRDLLYIESFFGRDFLKELCDIDSEFLKTGNKVLSLHAMDSTSLASALFLIALAKNETRREILEVFDDMMCNQLPKAEFNYTLAAGPPPKGSKHKKFLLLAGNAKFESLRGIIDVEVEGDDTLTPVQREFIRMAQIYKSRLVTELEYNQRIMERGLIEDRAGDYERELIVTKRREDEAKDKLRDLRVRVLDQQSQILGLLSTFDATLVSFRSGVTEAVRFTSDLSSEFNRAFAIVEPDQVKRATLLSRVTTGKTAGIAGLPNVLTVKYRARDAGGEVYHQYGFKKIDKQDDDLEVLLVDITKTTTLNEVLGHRYDFMQSLLNEIEQIKLAPEQVSTFNLLQSIVTDLKKQRDDILKAGAEGGYTLNTTVMPIYRFYVGVRPLLEDTVYRLSLVTKSAALLSADLGGSETPLRRIAEGWNTVQDRYYDTFSVASSRTGRTLGKVRGVDDALRNSLQLDQQYRFAIQSAGEARRPIDHRKLLDMLIDQIEEKYIELLEGTRSHIANIDGYIKTMATALDDDLNTQFYLPAFREIRRASSMYDVQLGQVETTTILTNNRMFGKVSPAATMEFDLPKRDILINEAFNGAKAVYDDYGALLGDPTFLSLAKMKGGQPTSSLTQGLGGGSNTVRNVLPGNTRTPDEQLLSQAGSGRKEFGAALEALIPDPAIYKFETGTDFEVTPVIQPDGQSVVFDFNYMYTTNVREPVRADEKHLGRVKRQFVHTPVQLSNYELREVSKYQVALKASRTSRGVPLLEDIPGVGLLFRPLPSAESSLQQNLIMAQTTIFPTLFDLMGLRWAPAVADLDTMRLRNDEFVVRQRHKDLENQVFDRSSEVVDDALRIAPGQRRRDLYRSQETIPNVHPDGYKGPGGGLRDSQLREGYSPKNYNPDERYVPSESREMYRGVIVPPTGETERIEGLGIVIPPRSNASSPYPTLPPGHGPTPSGTSTPTGLPPLSPPSTPVDGGIRRSNLAPGPRAPARAAAPPRPKPAAPPAKPTAAPTADDAKPKRGLSRIFQRD